MYAIEVHNLTKQFKDVQAVDGISFQVEHGELFGFLGVNGAGKSTTINMLCTLFPQTNGTAHIYSEELGKNDDQIRKLIGVVYQKDCLDELLSVKDNLMIRGAMYESDRRKLKMQLQHVCQILDLKDILSRPFGKLSGGQKRRCEIARALMHAPKILFLDEPTTGLDPATRKIVWSCIDTLRKEFNMTVFLTTHYMEEAAKANHIAIIDHGKIKEFGSPYELKSKFASDQLLAYPKIEADLLDYLRINQIDHQLKDGVVMIPLSQTLEAIPLLNQLEPYLLDFEVVQGTMDDVFLNVTGKSLGLEDSTCLSSI